MASKPSAAVWPVASLLLSATLWGVVWYPLRLLEDQGMSGLWSTLVTYVAASVVGVAMMRGRWAEFARQPGGLLLIALANGWCNMAFILAVLDGHVVRVLLLFYLSPVWTTVLGFFLLDERLSIFSVLTLVLAMAGALVMLWDPALGFPWPQDAADWLALTSGMAFSVSTVVVRRLQGVSVPTKTTAAWFGVVLLAVAGLVITAAPSPHVTAGVWGAAVLLGLLGFSVMTLAVQYGVTHMPVHRSAVILLFELVAGALSSQWLTDEVVTMAEWVGGGLIIGAAYWSARSLMGAEHESD